MLAPGKCQSFKSYAQISERIYEYVVHFLMKPEKEVVVVNPSPSKKKNSKKLAVER